MTEVATPVVPVEAPDPFQGQEPTFEEFSEYRKDGKLPERFESAAAAPKKENQTPTAKAGSSEGEQPSETEQEKQEREKQERDDKGKFKAGEKKTSDDPLFTPEQQKAFDNAFRKREAKLRREFEQRYAARTSENTQDTPPAKAAAAAAETTDASGEPKPPTPPNLTTWTGTVEQYDRALGEFPAKLKAFYDAQRQQEQQTAVLQDRLATSEKATLKAHPDYKETFDALAAEIRAGDEDPLPPHVLRAIAEESEDPHGLTYHLAKNREEYQRLASITNPVEALRQVLRLEAKLQTSGDNAASAPDKNAKPKTAAPAPPEPVGARATATAFDVTDEKLSPDEWAAQRNAQLAKKRGR
jgi:hypothetical protein